MSPFVIFAISLTIAYVIYYAVMITRDLYGKKEENKSNEEVFDVSSITEEDAAVAVNESDGGFCIANKQYDTRYQNEQSRDDGYGNGIAGSGAVESGAAESGYSSDGNEADGSCHAGSYDSSIETGGTSSDNDDINQQKKTAAESLQERVNDQMESTSPIWINGLWQDEFTESLLRQGETKPGQPNIKTIPIKDEI